MKVFERRATYTTRCAGSQDMVSTHYGHLVTFAIPNWDRLALYTASYYIGIFNKMKAFFHYFTRTWNSGTFPTQRWSHYDNVGPRTTNIDEGWYNPLNHSVRMMHPSMLNFLRWLKSWMYEVNCRKLQLDANLAAGLRQSWQQTLQSQVRTEQSNMWHFLSSYHTELW